MRTETQIFRVVTISKNANSFGLHGHILVARTGEAWEVARCRCNPALNNWEPNQDIVVPLDGLLVPDWSQLGCEIPRQLPRCPKPALKQFFAPGAAIKTSDEPHRP